MLTTNDVGDLFQSMRIAYGGQWKHGADAIETWRRALSRWDAARIQEAANEALKHYVNHPPTLPQFMALFREEKKQTYLPAPSVPSNIAKANRVLIGVLMKVGAVDREQLMKLVALKNALAEEYGERPTLENLKDLERQLTELADLCHRQARGGEAFEARRKHCRRWGFPDPALLQ